MSETQHHAVVCLDRKYLRWIADRRRVTRADVQDGYMVTVECSDPGACPGWIECDGDHTGFDPDDEAGQPAATQPAADVDGTVADALGRILAAQYDERVQRLESKIAEAEREIASLEVDAEMNRNIHRKAVSELEGDIRERDAVIEGLTAERHEHAANAATAWEMADAATERASRANRMALKVNELGSSGGWAVTLTLLITFVVGGTAGAAFGAGASFATLALGGFIATMISTTTTTKQKEMIDSWDSRKSTHSTS